MAGRKTNAPTYERASGSGLHEGHRERMRNKFKSHGDKVFETHELMEMLLYHIVPYRDTNPTAWRLMKKFSTLDGLALATRDEILSVDGIGERSADFLFEIFGLISSLAREDFLFSGEEFLTKEDVGRFLLDYYADAKERDGEEKYRVVAIMLDSDMRILSLTEPYEIDAGSGAVRSRPFIEAAVAAHANGVIIAHNHPYSTSTPTNADKVTTKLLADDLDEVGITLIEHFVLSGNDYSTVIDRNVNIALRQNSRWERAKDGAICLPNEEFDPAMMKKTRVLNSLLSLVMKKERAFEMSTVFSRRFLRLIDLFSSEMYVLKKLSGSETTAFFLKLFFSIYVRRAAERFSFGKVHTKYEIAEYFVSLIGYEPIEKVYVMMFDSRLRPIHCEFVSEGTVDSSSFSPRRLVEIAKRVEASGVVFAHNHPSSGVEPSKNDINATDKIKLVFETAGVKFHGHYIVSHNDFCIIEESGCYYKKDFKA